MDQDKCKTFLQKYEQELRHLGESDTRRDVHAVTAAPQVNEARIHLIDQEHTVHFVSVVPEDGELLLLWCALNA